MCPCPATSTAMTPSACAPRWPTSYEGSSRRASDCCGWSPGAPTAARCSGRGRARDALPCPTRSRWPSERAARATRPAVSRLDGVPVPADPSPALAQYAHPERLVTADWLSANLRRDGLVVVESDEDVLLYDVGHIPGAVKIDWVTDLNDHPVRDYLDGAQFAALMDRKGITRDDTVVIYGDKSNWWAAYA